MGKPKAWLPFGNELMLPRVVRILREVVDPVVVVAAPRQDVPPLPAEVQVVRDEVEGCGPLGGLAAGLAALEGKADAAYLSSCDVPLLQGEFVRRVVGLLEEPPPPTPFPEKEGGESPSPLGGGVGEGSAVAVPFITGRLHPLAAVYRVAVLPVIRERLAAKKFRMTDLLSAIPSRIVPNSELESTDTNFYSLWNLNTPEEYEAALRALLAAE
jgi:molybdopterin-guanine dinucleotide biosynthesis protein A